jgi:hypothetical protein
MRDTILPNCKNLEIKNTWQIPMYINGGAWQIKLREKSYEYIYNLLIKISFMMINETILKDEIAIKSKLVIGLSYEIRKDSSAIDIKIWNKDGNQGDIKDLVLLDDSIKAAEILYRPNVNQRM